ncbi:predicted protein [Postia placenta Mad-698-R]|nr:predicted protein [Postia placenta Mad-698-R]
MASPSAGDTTKQLWDEALTRVLATLKRNSELEARVTELELELSVWKQAHSGIVEMAERDKKAHNAQVATLNRQISSIGFLKASLSSLRARYRLNTLSQDQHPLILCVIDGDANIFHPSLLVQGQQGGRQAAQELTKAIAEYLSQEEAQVFGRLSFWVTVYYNRRGLLSALQNESICNGEQFEGFLSGLSQASPRFHLVDVGPGRDGTDVKIKDGHDGTYTSTLMALEKEELLGKVILLHGGNVPPEILQQLPVHIMPVDGLFMLHAPSYVQRRPGPIPLTGLKHNVTTHGGLISPESETYSTIATARKANGTKPIDSTKGANCKYSHEWYLSPEQLDILSKNAKKAPCNYLKNGMFFVDVFKLNPTHPAPLIAFLIVPSQGHICPSGVRCFHLSKGKCWFKGDGMHPILVGGED